MTSSTGVRWAVTGTLTLSVISFAMLGGGATAGAQDGAPSSAAEAELTKLRDKLASARGKSRIKARQAIQDAVNAKGAFVKALFNAPGQSLFGCSDSAKLISAIEGIDFWLELAADGESAEKRRIHIENAFVEARAVKSTMSGCSGADPIDNRLVGELFERVQGLPKDAKQDLIAARATEAAAKKAELLADERIFGCEVVRVYLLVKDIDLLASAARSQGTKRRNQTLDKAVDEVDHLVDEFKLMPCGDDPSPNPTPEPEPEPTPQPQACGTATATVFAGNERQFNIGNCGYGLRQAVTITSLSLAIPGNTITNELPPAGGSCTVSNSGGNGTYSCTGSMGQSLSLNLDFAASPAGKSASYSVNGGQYSGTIAIP